MDLYLSNFFLDHPLTKTLCSNVKYPIVSAIVPPRLHILVKSNLLLILFLDPKE